MHNKWKLFVCHAVAQTIEKKLKNFNVNELLWVTLDKTEHLATFQEVSCDESASDEESDVPHITVKFQSDDSLLEVPIDCVRRFLLMD